MPDRPTIIVTHHGDRFEVAVDPPQPEQDWDRSFETHREARGWAGGIRLSTGWKMVDQASDAALTDTLDQRRQRRCA